MPDPQVIQIKKYPNRRLYDQTRSRHLTHDELYDLVIGGHTVIVTESSTGQDITNAVLMQALLDRTPVKLTAVPTELLHLIIRASDGMLHSFFARYFEQLWAGLSAMQRPFSPQASVWPTPGAQAFNPFSWMTPPGAAQPHPEPPLPPSDEEAPPDDTAALRDQLSRLSAELARLNQRLNTNGEPSRDNRHPRDNGERPGPRAAMSP